MQNYAEAYNGNIDDAIQKAMVKVLVTGASGFIGGRLVYRSWGAISTNEYAISDKQPKVIIYFRASSYS